MIQAQRLKAILTILGVVYNNTKGDVRTTSSKSTNQEIEIADNQYHIIQQESILSNTVTENDIYDNYTYTSCINWEIEKTPETHSKK